MKKLIFSLLAASAAVVNADVTFSPFAFNGALNDASGADINGTYVMVLDLDNDGFDFGNIASDTWNFDADDTVLARGAATDGNAYPFWTSFTPNLPAGYDGTDDVYLFWFDTAYDAGATGAGALVDFGVENLGDVGVDPGTYTPIVAGGDALYQTIPEPATFGLMGLTGLVAFFQRKRLFKK